jgi:HAMP domain-containing protein
MRAALPDPWAGYYTSFAGTRVQGGSAPIPGTDWLVVTEIPQAEIMQASRQSLYLLDSTILVFGLLVMWLIARHTRRVIFLPLEQLQQGAQRIGGGDLSHRILYDTADELGQVSRAFNEMAERLGAREAQLAANTAALAAEVAERARRAGGPRQRGPLSGHRRGSDRAHLPLATGGDADLCQRGVLPILRPHPRGVAGLEPPGYAGGGGPAGTAAADCRADAQRPDLQL